MDVREATPDDQPAIREIAERSLEASYSLSPQAIESAVRQWYAPEEYTENLDRSDTLVLVAVDGDDVIGFTESVLLDEEGLADLLWLHVHPDYRGEGVGSTLFEETRARLKDRGAARMRGRVLVMNEAGNTFYRNAGFEKVDEDTVEIDGSRYTEALYVESEPSGLTPLATPNGTTVFVDHDEVERGSLGVFHVVFADGDREERYGYHCGRCDTLDTAMDTMGRIECNQCGNTVKPTRWDAAYM
ncbi:MAG: GNAT family N-acetyltransferase [Haloarculaceae archaeon]